MSEGEIDDVLRELRGHIEERSHADARGVEGALQTLGDAAELARMYRVENARSRAARGHSPFRIMHALLVTRWESVPSFLAAAATMFGYLWSLALVAAAIDKLLEPSDIGLWHVPGRWWSWSVSVDGRGPAGASEILGWWFVPLGLIAGVLLMLATNRFGMWWIRRVGRSGAIRTE